MCIFPRENRYFQGFEYEQNIKTNQEKNQKRGYEKETQKSTLNIDFRSHFGFQNFSKSIKKLSKNDAEKDNQKSGLRTLPKKPVLASEREARSSLRNVGTR